MKPNTILLIIATIFLLAGAYWYFVVDSGNQSTLSATQTPGAAQTQFDALVSELQPISFDTSIFSDPRFSALVDIATPVSPESVGRVDPLATFSSALGFAAPAPAAEPPAATGAPSALESLTAPGN